MSDNLALPLESCHHPQSLLGMGGIVVSILKPESSVEAWSIAMYTNAELYTQRSRSTSHFSRLPALVVQTLLLDLKLVVK